MDKYKYYNEKEDIFDKKKEEEERILVEMVNIIKMNSK
jgi:hypothetical protein